MNDRFQRESIGDGVWFSSVTDPKFKHNRISANLLVGLESETASVNAALPFILRRGCRSCPDFTMLNQKLCELYGASLSCDVSKFGGYQVLELSIYGIDDRFTLDNAPLARECAALLCDVLLDPKLSDGAFDEQDTALERQQLVDTIEGQINDKRLYALTRCKSLMCAGEPIAVDKYGSIPDAKAITARLGGGGLPPRRRNGAGGALLRGQRRPGRGEGDLPQGVFRNPPQPCRARKGPNGPARRQGPRADRRDGRRAVQAGDGLPHRRD